MNDFRYFLEDSAFAGPGAVVTPLAIVARLLLVLDVIDWRRDR